MKMRIAVLPGDGVGPEIVREAVRVLGAVARKTGHEFEIAEHPVGGAAHDLCGDCLPAATLAAASRLVGYGVRVQKISESVYGTVPLRRLRLERRFLQNLQVAAGGTVAVGSLAPDDYAREGCDDTDSENFVDIARSVSGCRYAAFVRRVTPERKVNVSLRAAPPHDVAAICAEWGGGGHKAAAGATLEMDLEAAIALVRDRLVKAASGS